MTRDDLINYLVRSGALKTPRIIEAFRAVDRADFVTPDFRDYAYEDHPLLIGYGQTISQPYVVAFMLELLGPRPGDKVLDIGSGSGWTTTLLAHIVSPSGKVFAIERVSELKDFGEKNCAKYNFVEKGIAKFISADGTLGIPQEAPFDRILASAAVYPPKFLEQKIGRASLDIPGAWREQLKIGGKIVVPIGSSVWLFTKKGESEFGEKEFYGFGFVPLVKD